MGDNIINLISSVIGAIIGGCFSIFILKKQTSNQKVESNKLNVSSNYPLLTYHFGRNIDCIGDVDHDVDHTISLGDENINSDGFTVYETFLKIENCGLNLAKNVLIDIKIKEGNHILYSARAYNLNDQIIIKKDNTLIINILANLKSDFGTKKCELTCSYKDVFGYKYKEKVVFTIKPTPVFSGSTMWFPLYVTVDSIVQIENPLLNKEG